MTTETQNQFPAERPDQWAQQPTPQQPTPQQPTPQSAQPPDAEPAPETAEARARRRAEREAVTRRERERRQTLALSLADPQDGVVTLSMLLEAGMTRGQIDAQLARGAWHRLGRHTVCVTGSHAQGTATWWTALWESGRHAALDGTTALLAAGLRGWTEKLVHVTVPNGAHPRPLPGVLHHRMRERAPVVGGGLRRVRPEVAAIRAAQWAASDRAATTLLAMTIQQRLATSEALLARWDTVGYSARRPVLDPVIRDLCDGAQSLGELDFARLCRARGLPAPDRQAVMTVEGGRVYLDAFWEAYGVRAEINGAQHYEGTSTVDDALRANGLGIALDGALNLTIPVLGLRFAPDRFLDQVALALEARGWRPDSGMRPTKAG